MEAQKKFEGKHSELTGKILGAFFQLHKELGFGFSEKVYETALEILLIELGMIVQRQKPAQKVSLLGQDSVKLIPLPLNPCCPCTEKKNI